MIKRLMLLLLSVLILSGNAFAETLTTNTYNVPVQINYNSAQVKYVIPDIVQVTKLGSMGNMYAISYGDIEGWINKAYTVEGAAELGENPGSDSNSGEVTMAEVAAERKRYVRKYRYYYCVSGPIVPANYKKTRKIDCSSFVSDVIYHYAEAHNREDLMSLGRQRSYYFNGVGAQLKSGSTSNIFELVRRVADARPGDILCYNGHVEIYAGGSEGSRPMVYNCGGDSAIRSGVITRSSYPASKLTYILRVKN